MDWSEVWHLVLGRLGGDAVLLLAAGCLAKTWIGVRIKEAVRAEGATSLEKYKAHLQEQLSQKLHALQIELQDTAERNAADRGMFRELLRALPSAGAIASIRDMDIKAFMLTTKDVEEAEVFSRTWALPEYGFLDPELETRSQHLQECLSAFTAYAGSSMWVVEGSCHVYQVPTEWKYSQPGRYEKACARLTQLAREAVAAHEDLVHTCRAKLRCGLS